MEKAARQARDPTTTGIAECQVIMARYPKGFASNIEGSETLLKALVLQPDMDIFQQAHACYLILDGQSSGAVAENESFQALKEESVSLSQKVREHGVAAINELAKRLQCGIPDAENAADTDPDVFCNAAVFKRLLQLLKIWKAGGIRADCRGVCARWMALSA